MSPSTNFPVEPPTYRRIVVKAGTNVLTGGTEGLSREAMARLVHQVAGLRQSGIDVILVTSGAVAAGREELGLQRDRRDIPFRQVLASVGQSRLMHIYKELFDGYKVSTSQALVSRKDLTDRLGYLNIRNTLLALLELKVVPVCNENDVVAVEELTGEGFGENDTLSALVANLVDADLLVILTDIEGLHTADPNLDPTSALIPHVKRVDETIEALAGRRQTSQSRGGMLAKLEAAKLATSSGVAVIIADGQLPDSLSRAAAGGKVGTLFPATAAKMESRKRWMLSGLSTRGDIRIDAGAASAVKDHGHSLLPAGVLAVRGSFLRGDIVAIASANSPPFACGIANYSSLEVDTIRGLRSELILPTLGYQYGEEVVHRNNLVLLDQDLS